MELVMRTFLYQVLALGCFLPLTLQMSTLWDHQRHLGHKTIYPDEYLHHLGYLDDGHGFWMHTRAERRQAISLYQRINGLNETGKIDKSTWSLMKQPRCGVPDVGVISPGSSSMAQQNGGHSRRKRATRQRLRKAIGLGAHTYKWLIPHIRWRPGRLTHTIGFDKQKELFTEAFRRWTKPTNLIVSKTFRDPEIEIGFNRREHGDGWSNAFDGAGMRLAHAFPPGDLDISGDVHFDLDEPWSFGVDTDQRKTRDLMMTTMHEAGHALGLPHSMDRKDIMYPVYLSYDPDPHLSRGDIEMLQRLYGAKPGYTIPPEVFAKEKEQEKEAKLLPKEKQRRRRRKRVRKNKRFLVDRKLPRWCRTKFNAVVLGPDGVGLVFMKKKVYRINNEGVLPGYPVHVGHEFPGAPINPTTVFYVRDTKKFYFFKGKRIWRFTNRTLDEGYPQRSKSNFYKKPSTAIAFADRRGRTMVYFFGEKLMWRWNFYTERVNGRYHSVKSFWRGLPDHLDAAVEWLDGYIYFFQHNKYYRVSKRTQTVMRGYPLYKGSAWLGGDCGSEPK